MNSKNSESKNDKDANRQRKKNETGSKVNPKKEESEISKSLKALKEQLLKTITKLSSLNIGSLPLKKRVRCRGNAQKNTIKLTENHKGKKPLVETNTSKATPKAKNTIIKGPSQRNTGNKVKQNAKIEMKSSNKSKINNSTVQNSNDKTQLNMTTKSNAHDLKISLALESTNISKKNEVSVRKSDVNISINHNIKATDSKTNSKKDVQTKIPSVNLKDMVKNKNELLSKPVVSNPQSSKGTITNRNNIQRKETKTFPRRTAHEASVKSKKMRNIPPKRSKGVEGLIKINNPNYRQVKNTVNINKIDSQAVPFLYSNDIKQINEQKVKNYLQSNEAVRDLARLAILRQKR